MSNVHDINTYYSWLVYYLGNTNSDGFISTAFKMSYPILIKR